MRNTKEAFDNGVKGITKFEGLGSRLFGCSITLVFYPNWGFGNQKKKVRLNLLEQYRLFLCCGCLLLLGHFLSGVFFFLMQLSKLYLCLQNSDYMLDNGWNEMILNAIGKRDTLLVEV